MTPTQEQNCYWADCSGQYDKSDVGCAENFESEQSWNKGTHHVKVCATYCYKNGFKYGAVPKDDQ